MGAVASSKLPQGFCFGTPDSTHDLLTSFLSVLATTSNSVFYSPTEPTNPAVLNSIWVKTTESGAGTYEIYIYTPKYLGASGPSWCRYYGHAIGDIEMLGVNPIDENETETARATNQTTRNYRPFAVCDGDTYGNFITPNLTGKVLYGGFCGHTDATKEYSQINAALKLQAPFATEADLATPTSRNAYAALDPLRMYVESGDPHNTAALLDAETSLRTFRIGETIPTNRQGARKVVLKRDQVPDHNHKYGWETWVAQSNRVGTSGGARGAANPGTGSAAIYTDVVNDTATTNTYTPASSAPVTTGRPHDNLPPVVAGFYRVYIGYGT